LCSSVASAASGENVAGYATTRKNVRGSATSGKMVTSYVASRSIALFKVRIYNKVLYKGLVEKDL
jgi:hypothetical protein